MKANEYLYRRVDLADAVDAHVKAIERAPKIGFGGYIISATTPFTDEHLAALRTNAGEVVGELYPKSAEIYGRLGWKMFAGIDRVYVNQKARGRAGVEAGRGLRSCAECARTRRRGSGAIWRGRWA